MEGIEVKGESSLIEPIPLPESAPPKPPVGASLLTIGQSASLIAFGKRLATSTNRLLLLDYDGTLAPFRVERMEAHPYPGITEELASIIAIGDVKVVIISGRIANEVATLLDLNPAPEIWGCHGWERLVNGKLERFPLSGKQEEGIARALFTLKKEGLKDRLEQKHGSLALHWRGASLEEASNIEKTGLRAMGPAARNGLNLKRFDGGLELRAAGRDKGMVVKTLLETTGENSAIAYLGDDQTDEDAFKALGERGLGVLVRPEPRETAATVWLKPPEELHEFLRMWI